MTRSAVSRHDGGVRVAVEPALDGALAAELRSRVLFVDDAIEDFDLVADGSGAIAEVVLRGAGLGDGLQARRKLLQLLEEQVRPQIPLPAKVPWRSSHRRDPDPDTFDRLVASGWASVQGEGQVAVGGPVLDAVRALDALLVRCLRENFDATEFSYPTLVPSETLLRAGYFASFPHHLMFVTRLHNDLDVYREFERDLASDVDFSRFLEHCRTVDYCLPPTMCYHTFAQHGGQSLEGFRVVTARGKSFRHESGYHTTMERLWDFTIREMVFLGTRDEVLDARHRVLDTVQQLVEDLGLEAWREVANDPFFGSDAVPDAIGSQRMLELKYELRMPVGPGNDVAVGSFNFHDDVFGERFAIGDARGGAIRSACIGFGLERFALAVLAQHGISPDGWPTLLRAERAHLLGR